MFTHLRKSIQITLLVSAYLLLSVQIIFAGTTGKIAGKVTDAATGETVIGANIILMGHTLGGAADIDGNYYIINIPPGTYDVRASSIGYESVTVQNVRVSVDQTTKIDFQLDIESVEIGDVVVTAIRPMVRKDLTSTEAKVSGDDIALLPLEDVASVVNLQAGVVNGHFRGGRRNEVKYLVDGVAVNDAFTGESALSAEVNAVEEIQVLIGTFNAEYGEALSGIVNQITKIAKDDIEGDISFFVGDYVSSRDDVYTNINEVSPTHVSNLQGSISGPIPGLENAVKFFLSGRYFNDEGYIYGQRQFNPSDSSDFSANDPDDWHVAQQAMMNLFL